MLSSSIAISMSVCSNSIQVFHTKPKKYDFTNEYILSMVSECNAQRDWRSCMQLEKIKINCGWWWACSRKEQFLCLKKVICAVSLRLNRSGYPELQFKRACNIAHKMVTLIWRQSTSEYVDRCIWLFFHFTLVRWYTHCWKVCIMTSSSCARASEQVSISAVKTGSPGASKKQSLWSIPGSVSALISLFSFAKFLCQLIRLIF